MKSKARDIANRKPFLMHTNVSDLSTLTVTENAATAYEYDERNGIT